MDSVLSTTVRGTEYVPRYVRGADGWIDWSHLPNHFEPTHAQPPSTALETLPTARRQTLNDARKVVFTIITKPRHVLSRARVQRRQSLRTRRPAPPHPPQTIPSLPPSPSATSKISPFLALTNLDQSPDNSNADVSAAVEDLLNTLSNKFASVSSEIFAKMDEMSRRLDNLEAALQETKANESSGSTKS
ncbi:Heat shock factor binding 1 [Metarhizium guizhouense ARSEF 977]|uniref:Heat shock factor binding 1 n=1 Tax=Metarhizium guizhouense (strain ARSEF 977) TaxID=1276136 RepID=A0A0B4GZN5_METGA|nr:Heat shock factor binding 1 [Metarhizium guizhouense ARSEF 977]